MHPRHRLDLSLGDVAHGLRSLLRAPAASASEAAVLDRLGLTGQALVTLSVRSGWDLLLGVLGWPVGSEVLVSAVTHPDMETLLRAHGLVPVPVDLDPDTLLPPVAALAAAVTPRTRAVLLVQLFGGRSDLTPYADLCRAHDLLLVEDAAQAYAGPDSLAGTPADVSLTSFGLIKTSTAVGGAVLVVRDPERLAAMRASQASWPRQRRRAYVARLLRAAALVALTRPTPYGRFFRVAGLVGLDPDAVICAATRSYAGTGEELLARLRVRPGDALVALLARRVAGPGADRLIRRAAAGEQVATTLPRGLTGLGAAVPTRTHWLFPALTDRPAALVARLRRAGLDASAGTSNLVALGPATPGATAMMRDVVYLPVYPELDAATRTRLLRVLHAHQAASAQPDGPAPSPPE